MYISFVIPTRNRAKELADTLEKLQRRIVDDLGGAAEIIIVDNGSDVPMDHPSALINGIGITPVYLNENIGAGARNIGVEHAKGEWVIMLDDDSSLCPGPVGEYLSNVDPTIGAIGGEILLPDGSHEAGGLPEVVVGCGCAFRRDAFLEVGGYDATFGYYVEEYDLCAKLIAAGYSIRHTQVIGFEHRKSLVGREMNEILFRLVRNNGWVIERYAPAHLRADARSEMLARYKRIAIHENALDGYHRGHRELEQTVNAQMRTTLSGLHWDRFVGNTALCETLAAELDARSQTTVSIVGPPRGKGLVQIRNAIEEYGHTIVEQDQSAQIQIIGTLSPGPMLDASLAFPDAICPWSIESPILLSAGD